MKSPQKIGKASNAKGKAFEREFAREATKQGLPSKRNYQFRGEAKDGPDVYIDAPGWPRMSIECKCRKVFSSSNIVEALKTNDAVAVRIKNKGTFVAIDVKTFWAFLKIGGLSGCDE